MNFKTKLLIPIIFLSVFKINYESNKKRKLKKKIKNLIEDKKKEVNKEGYSKDNLKEIYTKYFELAKLQPLTYLKMSNEREYTEEEVSKFNGSNESKKIYFIFKGGVYDLTDWYDLHETLLNKTKLELVRGKELTQKDCPVFFNHIIVAKEKSPRVAAILINSRIGKISKETEFLYPILKNENEGDMVLIEHLKK
jgi:predicted heme/steroid binding protein